MIDLKSLSDDDLTSYLRRSVARETKCSAEVIRTLIESDRRKLYKAQAYPSLFAYCVGFLGYSEDAAAKRIHAARAAKDYPSILGQLRDGEISLTAVQLLAPHLTSANHRSLLDWARGRSRRELEIRIAALRPRPELREVVRHLRDPEPQSPPSPAPTDASGLPHLPGSPPAAAEDLEAGAPPLTPAPASSPAEPLGEGAPSQPQMAKTFGAPNREPAAVVLLGPSQRIEPLTPQRIRFAFTGTEIFLAKVERCRQLLRHKYPSGRLEEVFSDLVETFLDQRDPDRRKKHARPGSRRRALGRSIPQWVKDAVWKRDGGRCCFAAKDGRRCGSRDFLEFDHVRPWSVGGASDDPGNVRILCRAHNQHEAIRILGEGRAGFRPATRSLS